LALGGHFVVFLSIFAFFFYFCPFELSTIFFKKKKKKEKEEVLIGVTL
jgi:alkyl hydroperoxide reductase subunit AhpC